MRILGLVIAGAVTAAIATAITARLFPRIGITI